MIGVVVLFVLIINNVVTQELISPCPRLFMYEPRNPNEPDRIYGVLTLIADSDLSGIWIRIIFDKPSLQLANWFGQVKTDDNKIYRIQSPNKKLLAHTPTKVRFYVKYDLNEPPPKVVEWRLNAKTVCPESSVTTETPVSTGEYYTSPELAVTPRPSPVVTPTPLVTSSPTNLAPGPGDISNIGNYYQPVSSGSSSGEDDDFFVGDFALLGKPKPFGPILEEQCGTVIKSAQPLITYGQPTQEGEFPWHVALYHARGIDLTYICGASLITVNHVITVAHCVTRRKSQTALPPTTLMIYLGKYYLRVWSNPGIQDRQVEKIIVHQKYNSHTFANDIAVLKLSQPADITDFVRPVCIWEEDTRLEGVIGKQGIVVGWGFDQTGKVTEQLTKAHMPVVSQETCIYSFPEFYSRFTSDHTYCAGFNNGKDNEQQNNAVDWGNYSSYIQFLVQLFRNQYSGGQWNESSGTSVCNGDSGGGMVFPRTGTDRSNPIYAIRGMVSISVALQNQFRCDSSHYVVFTDIAKYLDWIKNALQL